MPRYPGASRRCDECQQRRKRCDLNEPECHRCSKAGVKCSGPKDRQTFIHRNATNLSQQSHRMALVCALQGRRPLKPHANYSDTSGGSACILPRRSTAFASTPSPLLDIMSMHFPGGLTYLALIEDFKPGAQQGIFSGDRISRDLPVYSSVALCIRALLPLASSKMNFLDLSIFSLLVIYMGGLRGDAELGQLARLSYTSALEESHPHIQKVIADSNSGGRQKTNLHLLLWLAIAFQVFEFVSGNDSTEAALFMHVGGALSVLELSGPEQYRSEQQRQAFSGFRGILVSVALQRRQPTFLAEPDWLHLPFRSFRKTRRELLHDIALQIPRLLCYTDRFVSGSVNDESDYIKRPQIKDHDLEAASSLLTQYSTVLHQMEAWLSNWKASEQGPLYWPSTLPMPSTIVEVDAECIPIFTGATYQLRFSSGQKAGLLIAYWGFLLELLMGLIDLERNLANIQNKSLKEHLDMAQETAFLILETIPYLSSCFEGTVASKEPLRTVARYFERQHLGGQVESLNG